jgi:hypothetical protein
MGEPLNIWTLYDNPSDMPGYFVLRRYEAYRGFSLSTPDVCASKDIEEMRNVMRNLGLHCIPRHDGDEPHIVEIWI